MSGRSYYLVASGFRVLSLEGLQEVVFVLCIAAGLLQYRLVDEFYHFVVLCSVVILLQEDAQYRTVLVAVVIMFLASLGKARACLQ